MPRDFYSDFLGELEALDDFLLRRHGGEQFVKPEDPDVRRLMEALAFFSARTQAAASHEVGGAIARLAHGLLEDFTTPQPARALLRARPSARFTEAARLPRGSRVRLETADGDVGQFTTMADLVVRPLELDRAELQPGGTANYRVLLRLRSRVPVVTMTEPLSLHIDQLGDYEVSRRFAESLRQHVKRVAVVYGDPPSASEPGLECSYSHGSPRGDVDGAPLGEGRRTVARIREFFHFPAKELALHIGLPRPPRPWRQAWLCLDLDEWPEGQVVRADMFRLFVVPIENLFTELAEPIKCDGTRGSYPIRPWRVDGETTFHSVVEVQQELATGMEPLLPGHLASGDRSFDVDFHDADAEPRLLLRLPDAFLDPRNVLVRARWYQPHFDATAVGKLEATLQSRHFEGVEFQVQGGLVPHRRSPLSGDADAMLHVLSRRSKRVLSRNDIVKLMATLGAGPHGYHGEVAADIRQVEVHDEPTSSRESGGVQHVYQVSLADVAAERVGLVDDYLECVGELVNAWSNNPTVIRKIEHNPRKRGEAARTKR